MDVTSINLRIKKQDSMGLYYGTMGKGLYWLMERRFFGCSLALSLMLFALNSCSFKEPAVLLKMSPLPDGGRICQVAVLPFANQTRYSVGGPLMTKVFTSEMIKTGGGMIVAHEGDVRKVLMQLRVLPGQTPTIDKLKALADRIGVQLVIIGEVMEMRDKDRYGRILDPVLAVVVRIVDADSGRTLWTTYLRREGKNYQKIMHWGLENTITGLSQRVSREIISAWQNGGLNKCE